MQYKELTELYQKLESTSKRLGKTYFISKFLEKTSADDLPHIVLLLQSRLYPSWDEHKIGVASRIIIKAINVSFGISTEKIENEWRKTGDLGKTAENLVNSKKQATLSSKQLTVRNVFDNLKKLAVLEGSGSVDQKVKLLSELLTSAKPMEARYIVRTVLEELRVGTGEGALRDAIMWAYLPKVIGIFFKCKKCHAWMPSTTACLECGNEIENKFEKEIENVREKNILRITEFSELEKKDIKQYDFILCSNESLARQCYNYFAETVQHALDLTCDFGVVAIAVKKGGIKSLLNLDLEVGRPVKVMLYPKAKGIEDAFNIVGRPGAFEFKYDGFRLECHKKGREIVLFTRRLENVTAQFPDVVSFVKENVKGDNFILDGEAVGYDPKTKKYLPFQSISQRIRRKYDIDEMAKKFPVELNVFDVLIYNNKSLLKEPFIERRKLIEKIITEKPKKIVAARQLITDKEENAEKFYKEALSHGQEGVMVKALNAGYKPGSRVGYGVKVKPVMESLDLVVVGADWGEGKRAKWLSSFTIACKKGDEFLEIGKVGTGIKEKGEEATFKQLTELLKPLIITQKGKSVKVRPGIILEIEYEEIQKSPTYASGFALRFPRLVKIRFDLGLDDVKSIASVKRMFEEQKK